MAAKLAVVRLKNGTILWPFYQEFVKEPCCQVRRYSTYVYRSGDSGKTWQGDEPIQVPMREPIPYGRILELSDGRLLMPVWGAWELGGRWQMGTFESTDAGHTWANYIQIGYDPKAGCRPDNGFTETSLAQISAQTLVAILRQQRVGTSGGPCDVYTEPAEHFYRAVSHDLGKTWSAPQMLPLIGTSPALFVTRSGTLVLGNRDHPSRERIRNTMACPFASATIRELRGRMKFISKTPRACNTRGTISPAIPTLQTCPTGRFWLSSTA